MSEEKGFAFNQLNRRDESLKQSRNVKLCFTMLQEFSQSIGSFDNGRDFAYSILGNAPGLDFNNMVVADMGARDGYLGAWLTGMCKHVYF